MAQTNTRQATRAPVTLKIKFKSQTLEQFIERYSVDISHGGIFIRTKEPLSVGTTLRFEFQLRDATPLIAGEGTVVWTREHDPARAGIAPGMGVRFDKLPSTSQKVLDQVLEQKTTKAPVPVATAPEDDQDDDGADDFVDTPTRVAPAALVDTLARSATDYEEGDDQTPLPRPMPFHSDAEAFPEEAFEEATRVASLDSLIAATEDDDEGDDDEGEDDQLDDENERAATELETHSASSERAATEVNTYKSQQETELNLSPPPPQKPPAATSQLDSKVEEHGDAEEPQESPSEIAAKEEPAFVAGLDKSQTPEADEGDDDLAAARSQAAVAKRAAVAPPSEDDRGGSMQWIAVAAVIMLLGGAGGFWLLNKKGESEELAQADKKELPATGTPESAALDPEAKVEVTPPPVVEAPKIEEVDVVIESQTSDSIASVEGTELSATTPATFSLEKGKTFTVVIAREGYVSKELEIVAGGDAPKSVTLKPMQKLLRITSEPQGAAVFLNGRRLKGKTPIEVRVDKRLEKKPQANIRLLLPGHQTITKTISLADGFAAEDENLVLAFNGPLKKKAVAVRKVVKKPVPTKTDVGDSGKTEDGDNAGNNTDPVANNGGSVETNDTSSTPPADVPEPANEKPEEPAPKEEDKPEAPAPESPAQSSPAPDWTK